MPVLDPSPAAESLAAHLLEHLDPGEAQGLATAAVADGTFVTDDADARAVADEREVPTTGSIGLLVRFVEQDALSIQTADGMLKRGIDEAGFRSPSRDIEDFQTK